MPRRLPERAAFAAIVLLAYVVAGRLVLNAYPVSVFDMYAIPSRPQASRLVVVADGARTSVSAWGSWRCEGGLDPATADLGPIPYKREERRRGFSAEGTGPVQAVRLVREEGRGEAGRWTWTEQEIASCEARPR